MTIENIGKPTGWVRSDNSGDLTPHYSKSYYAVRAQKRSIIDEVREELEAKGLMPDPNREMPFTREDVFPSTQLVSQETSWQPVDIQPSPKSPDTRPAQEIAA